MRIPEISMYNTGFYQYDRNLGAETVAEPAAPGISGTVEQKPPENRDIGQNGKLTYTPDGDILDFDWNRIRRFVQRFAWQTEPPDSVKDFRDYWQNKTPTFSYDGDKVEFDFKRPEFDSKTYKSQGADKANIVEPKGKCHTCESRRYVDKSNDSSVSYQTPTKLNPSTAALAVGAHEREHVFNERAKADREGREIVNQTVMIKYAICPECHKMYAAGGVTRTQSISTSGEEKTPSNDGPSPSQKPSSH